MLKVLAENVELVNAFLNGLMVLIWTVYLQIFLVSHLRSARSVIHIDIGAAKGARSRCLVTNLSSNPLYIQGIVADFSQDGHTSRTVITEREEIAEGDVKDPLARTNRGTLSTGQTIDIGSLDDLAKRAQVRLEQDWSAEKIDHITITVVAFSGQIERIVGASKTFVSESVRNRVRFSSRDIQTRQLRPHRARTAFNDLLRDHTLQ